MLTDFEDTQEEILNCHRVNITTHPKCRTATIGPVSEVDKCRFRLFDLLHQSTTSLELLLTCASQTFRYIKVQCVLIGFVLRGAYHRISLFIQKINYFLRCAL